MNVTEAIRAYEATHVVSQADRQNHSPDVDASDTISWWHSEVARDKEEHLVCTDVKTKECIVSKIVFTFCDDKLAMIEAKGNAVESLINSRKDTAINYLHYKVFPSELLIGDPKGDRVGMLTKESVHLHLFTWNNPYLGSKRPVPEYEPSAKIPDILKMGGRIDELTPVLRKGSELINIESLDGSDPNAQTQINCFGVEYAGFPRKLEVRFGDKKLNAVWILTATAEEDRIRKKLTEEYGKADPSLFCNSW